MIHPLRRYIASRRRNPARELAMMGIEKHRRDRRTVARQIRRELGLPDDPRIA